MSQVQVEKPLANILRETPHGTELVDAEGRVIGYFTPSSVSLRELYDWAWAEFDQRDFDSAVAEGGGRPLADILRDLRKPA
ncbi:MAG: hypothetical protein SH850_30305 [Planctomycetaceae bacterium]|nr:hypothetical protein [Planctomycetaceae bacterium]